MKRSSLIKKCGALVVGLAVAAATAMAEDGGALYTMDNAAGANHVIAFQRQENGSLLQQGAFATGGLGAGAGLSSQGSMVLSPDGRWVFACNVGSSEVSVM